MKQHFTPCPSGDVQIHHAAYSGCSDPPTERDDPESAMHRLAQRVTRWRAQGYPVTILAGDDTHPTRVEVSTPDNASMVGDVEGIYTIEPVMVRAYECWECDEVVPVGEPCDCQYLDDGR